MSDPHDGRPKPDWAGYYDATAGRPPRRTLLAALDRFAPGGKERRAADLGCGDGRDTIELLRRGWSVAAIDSAPAAIARLAARSDLPVAAKLDARCGKFEEVAWGKVDLVNASFALPLCPPAAFSALWDRITASLPPGGRFAGQLYGPRDGWADDRSLTVLDAAQARSLFAAYRLELFDEEESDAVTPRGKPKHWHIFHIVACKR